MLRIERPTWLKGFSIKNKKLKKGKAIIEINCGEVFRLHRVLINGTKLKIKVDAENKAYLRHNVLVYLNGNEIGYITNGLPMQCSNVMPLYSIDIIVWNCKVSDIHIEDLRLKNELGI